LILFEAKQNRRTGPGRNTPQLHQLIRRVTDTFKVMLVFNFMMIAMGLK